MSTALSIRLARSAGRDGDSHNPAQDVTVDFGQDRPRMNMYCKEAPGAVVFTDRQQRMRGTSIHCRRQNRRTTPSSRTDTGNAEIALANWLPSCLLLILAGSLPRPKPVFSQKSCLRRMLESTVGSILSPLRYAISRMLDEANDDMTSKCSPLQHG